MLLFFNTLFMLVPPASPPDGQVSADEIAPPPYSEFQYHDYAPPPHTGGEPHAVTSNPSHLPPPSSRGQDVGQAGVNGDAGASGDNSNNNSSSQTVDRS